MATRVRNAARSSWAPGSPVSLGDYCAGSDHVLPTGGAPFSSGLSVQQSFLRGIHVVEYTSEALAGWPATSTRSPAPRTCPRSGASASPSSDGGNRWLGLPQLPLRPELGRGRSARRRPQPPAAHRLNTNENPPLAGELLAEPGDGAGHATLESNRYPDRDGASRCVPTWPAYLSRGGDVAIGPAKVWAANGSNASAKESLQAFGGAVAARRWASPVRPDAPDHLGGQLHAW